MYAWFLPGDPDKILDRLLCSDEAGRLRFGWYGRTHAPAAVSDLLDGWVDCVDYILEVFVSYRVRLRKLDEGLRIEVEPRDGLLERRDHVKWAMDLNLQHSGLRVAPED